MKCSCGKPVDSHGMCKTCYMRWRYRQKGYGKWETVSCYTDAAPVQEHVLLLRDMGIGLRRLCELSGLPRRTVFEVSRRDPGKVRKETAAALLAVQPPKRPHDVVSPGQFVPALGTQRRLQALMCAGYSGRWLARQLGKENCYLNPVINGSRKKITARVAREVESLFDQLQFTQGANEQAMRLARERGYAPPMAWDDDLIDDPRAEPDLGKDKHLSFPERLAELEYLHIPRSEMPKWLGIQDESFERQLSRHQLKEAV